MGISVESWRVAIGSFHPVASAVKKSPRYRNGSDSNCKYSICLFWYIVLASLLLIANVEPNPGPYPCHKCNETFTTLRENAEHQHTVHSLQSNFVYTCPWPSCLHQIFCNYKALSVHLCKFHDNDGRTLRNDGEEFDKLKCSAPGCTKEFFSNTTLCHHLINDHGSKGETVTCPFLFCQRGPFKLSTFRVHLSTYHSGWRTSSTSTTSAASETISIEDSVPFSFDFSTTGNDDDPPSEHEFEEHQEPYEGCDEDRFFKQVAKFYLMLEAEHMLPTSTVQLISVALANLFRINLGSIKKKTIKALEKLQLSPTEKEDILSSILFADKLYCCHSTQISGPSFTTDALRKTFYKKNFTYIEPQEINLSKDPSNRKSIHVVSIKETLENLLRCPTIQKQVDDSFKYQEQGPRSDNCFSDYRDGSVYINSDSSKKKTIDLNIFMDSFNPLKDLGAAADSFDTLGMYMTIGNFKPYIRSKLQSMYLVMLIPKFKELYKQFKDMCFDHVIKELLHLEQHGIDYLGNKIPVVLQFLIGDSKGQNQIGGFVECFTALKYCRFCPMLRDEFRESPWEKKRLRTKEDYHADIREFKRLKRDDPNLKHVNGVKSSSPFNKLNEFQVTDPRLCPCIAHDIFEAIGDKYDMSDIINHLIESGWFSLQTLNRLIRKFKYSSTDLKNKPGKVQEHKMGGHAIQNWTLLRLLPFIIGQSRIVDPSDAYWKLYLKLKQICEYICAPLITTDQVDFVRGLIEEYLYERQHLLERIPQPKHHFLNHYADLIELMGPLIHLFTMRFESVHKFFKQSARNSRNVINIGKTMSKKSALYFCYLSTGFFCSSEGILAADDKILNLDVHPDETKAEIRKQNFSVHAHEADCVTVGDIEVRRNYWFLLETTAFDNITVGNVQCIVIDGGVVSLVMQTYASSLWHEYGLYKISVECALGIKTIPYSELSNPKAQSVYCFGGHQCYALKHTLPCFAHDGN